MLFLNFLVKARKKMAIFISDAKVHGLPWLAQSEIKVWPLIPDFAACIVSYTASSHKRANKFQTKFKLEEKFLIVEY